MNTLDYLKVASHHLGCLRERGIEISMSFDFGKIHSYAASLEKNYLTPKMDPALNDFTENNGFWILISKDGKLIGSVAARFDDIGRESISDFWQRSYGRHQPETLGKAFSVVDSTIANQMSGKIACIGELFIDKSARGSLRVLEHVTMIAHLNIALKWQPQYTYAFMWNDHVERGAAVRYGFTHLQQSVRRWKVPPSNRKNDEWLVVLAAEDLEHKVKAQLQSIDGARVIDNELIPLHGA